MNLCSQKTFGDVIQQFISLVSNVCSHEKLHVIFDSYLESSVKDGERLRRSDDTPIQLAALNEKTPISVSLAKFWASSLNKEKLQLLVREILKRYPNSISSAMVVADDVLPCRLHNSSGNDTVVQELYSSIEEADARTVPHILWAVQNGCKRAIVLSNDTDTVALLLYHINTFMKSGLEELWIRIGTGEKRRFLPLHELFQKKGEIFCKAVLKAHILTGEDCMSKIGTKNASMTWEPERYLLQFAETESANEQDFLLVEEYLVKVWSGVRAKTNAKTFNELRVEMHKNGIPINKLPPTSSVIKGHLLRGFYLIRKAISLLNECETQIDPLKFGWHGETGILLPLKCLNNFPDVLKTICKCNSNCDKRCKCKGVNLKCVMFCHNKKSQKEINCKNTSGNYDVELFE